MANLMLINNENKSQLDEGIAGFLNVADIMSNALELNHDVLYKYDKIVVVQDFLDDPNAYAKLDIAKYVYSAQIFYLYENTKYVSLMEDIATCICVDYKKMREDFLVACLDGDKSYTSKSVIEPTDILGVNIAKDILETGNTQEADVLAREYLAILKRDETLEDNLKTLSETIISLQDYVSSSDTIRQKVISEYNQLILEVNKTNKQLSQFNVLLNKDIYTKVLTEKYKHCPIILYFKEFEELIHLESFINTLYDTFRLKLQKTVKVLKIADSTYSKRINAVNPRYVKLIENTFNEKELYTNDFILKTGNHLKVMDCLLKNAISYDILIVIDQKAHADVCVIGNKVLHFNMCRNIKNAPLYSLSAETTICNNTGHPWCWEHIGDYNNLSRDTNKLFNKLSCLPVIENILSVYKTFLECVL